MNRKFLFYFSIHIHESRMKFLYLHSFAMMKLHSIIMLHIDRDVVFIAAVITWRCVHVVQKFRKIASLNFKTKLKKLTTSGYGNLNINKKNLLSISLLNISVGTVAGALSGANEKSSWLCCARRDSR